MSGTIVIASGNAGKLAELEALLGGLGVELVAQGTLGVEPAEETGATFVDNALEKARHASRATGLPAIADDSGLVVAALDGRPGIHSARYAGPDATDDDNVIKLLEELRGVDERAAYFHCAAVFVRDADDPAPLVAEASWHGSISKEAKGTAGFGYDPVFYDPELGVNSAEMSAAQKNARSHRGKAARCLAELLASHWKEDGSP